MDLYTQRRYCCSTLGLEDMFSKELCFMRSRSKKDIDSPDANATQTWQRRFGAAEAGLAKAAIAGSVAQQTGTNPSPPRTYGIRSGFAPQTPQGPRSGS